MKNKKLIDYFNDFFDWVNEVDESILFKHSKQAENKLIKVLNNIKEVLKKENIVKVNNHLTKEYYSYIKDDFRLHNKGLKGWRLNDLKSELREQLKENIKMSLNLIVTQDDYNMNKIRDRFLDWISASDMPDGNKETLKQALSLRSIDKKARDHQKFIMRDQSMKMVSNFDYIVAKHYEAIAFIWKNRQDLRVVGNPVGLYPKGNEKHLNHWDRENKIYFYPDSWAIKNNLLKNSKITLSTSLKDGMPGFPIGCRCHAINLYNLSDIPKEYLTKKGVERVETEDN